MNIFDYADTLNLELSIVYHPNQNGRFSVSFDGVEFKDKIGDGMLSGIYGNACSSELAIKDFINQINGKYIVLDRKNNGTPLRLKIPKLQYLPL